MRESNDIINKIRDVRISKNLTQEQIAAKLGVNRATYINIESGKRKLTIDELISLCHILGISLSSLTITSEEDNQRTWKKLKQIYYYILQKHFKNGVPKTKLAKLIYLSDFTYFFEHHVSMSGSNYIRLNYGPVAEKFFIMTDLLFERGKINIEILDFAQMISISNTADDIEPSALSDTEKRTIDKICNYWKDKRTSEIVNFTHSQRPWKECLDGEYIPYELILEEPENHIFCPAS